MNSPPAAATSTEEVAAGKRFAFGLNWAAFLETLDEERIGTACRSLQDMLGVTDLRGKSFLDVGSGSGLFSLAARRLGARVYSFDYDPQSVGCTEELRRRYFPSDGDWTVEPGSALDTDYLGRLGKFDIVYSWGVLHHTGAMWDALANVAPLVQEGGTLFIAIYNDQGKTSRRWLAVKRTYNRLPRACDFWCWGLPAGTCGGAGSSRIFCWRDLFIPGAKRNACAGCRLGATSLTGLADTRSRSPNPNRSSISSGREVLFSPA